MMLMPVLLKPAAVLLVVYLLLQSRVSSQTTSDVKAKTIYGDIIGTNTGKANIFRGVPYGRSPDGPRRFQPPEPPVAWGPSLIRHTKVDPPGCPQPNCTLPPAACPASISEDCLYLNVFAPVASPPQAGYPVMFWIHGGNFRFGFGGGELYNGQHLANSSSVVIVSINYRLGALGYLTTSSGLTGNYGVMDQRMALEWVRDNIAFFGGNPNSVTIFGQSAGAMSAAIHLTSPRSSGLYHRAIIESEPFGIYMRSRKDAQAQGAKFAKALGCGESDLECLQSKTRSAIVDAQEVVAKKVTDFEALLEFFIPWTPTIDGDQVIDEPFFSFQNGNLADVPIIIGTVSSECVAYIYAASPTKKINVIEYNAALLALFGTNAGKIKSEYVYRDTGNGDTRDHISVMGTDYTFRCPTRNATRSVVTSPGRTQPIYRYIFNYTMSFDGWGPHMHYCYHRVCHASELPFVWFPDDAEKFGFHYLPEEVALSYKLFTLWTNFAHTGNPNTPKPPVDGIWKPYGKNSDDQWSGTLNMTLASFKEFEDVEYESKRCDFWDSYGYRD